MNRVFEKELPSFMYKFVKLINNLTSTYNEDDTFKCFFNKLLVKH